MNYQIIKDEVALQEFVEWLPVLEKNQTYYVTLFARKKYSNVVLSSEKCQLKRFTATKENLIDKLRQLEVKEGSYYQYSKNGKVSIPQEALVVYIHLNPRDNVKATYGAMKKIIQLIENKSENYSLHQEILSEIQKAKAKHTFNNLVTFDIDTKNVDLSYVFEVVPKEAVTIIETRGGYHVVVDAKHNLFSAKQSFDNLQIENKFKQYPNNWYNLLSKHYNCETGDIMCPIVGTHQGGFVPKFYLHGN